MEAGGVFTESCKKSPKKRKNRDDDEISPTSLQKNKEARKMATSEEKLDYIVSQLSALSDIKADIKQIKEENSAFKQKLSSIDERVRKVEEKIESGFDQEAISGLKKEIDSLQHSNNALEQMNLNRTIIVRNLPKEFASNEQNTKKIIDNLFNALQISTNEHEYDAYSYIGKNKSTANINLELSSITLKKKVMRKFRAVKNSESEPKLVVERIVSIPEDHQMNGTLIKINNKLTNYNNKLLQYARQVIPTDAGYAFDNDDGAIKVKMGASKPKTVSTLR